MKLNTIAATLLLSTSLAVPGYAQVGGVDAGVGADAGASVGADGSSVGADVSADVDASVTTDTMVEDETAAEEEESVQDDSATLDQSGNAEVGVGTEIRSADGELIGTVAGTRTDTTDGSLQAVVALDEAVGLAVSQLAFEADHLKAESENALTYGMSLADLRSRMNAQIEGNAEAGASSE